jgi:hypothetical protein
MGNWNITICGVGCHHNKDLEIDANRLAAEFVQKMIEAGHNITHASFTHGGADDLSKPNVYLDNLAACNGLEQKPRCAAKVAGLGCRLVEDHEGAHEPPVTWK